MFRRAVIKGIAKRGGGHDHPDFPFLGYYKYKRPISIYDSNLWVYDGMNPEYLVDIQSPQYTYGHILSRNLIFGWILPFLFSWITGTIIYNNFKRPFIPTHITDDKDPVRRFLKRLKHEGVIQKLKHPLGHAHTYADEGWHSENKDFITNRYKL